MGKSKSKKDDGLNDFAKKEAVEIKSKTGNVEFYIDAMGKHRFRVFAKNGEQVGQGQGYTSAQGCKSGMAALRQVLKLPEIIDNTKPTIVFNVNEK